MPPQDADHSEQRVRRLEQQLLFFRELSFAALEYAHQRAADTAEQQGVASPTEAEVNRDVVALMEERRDEWAARRQQWVATHQDADEE
jgi:hypothetical protein